MKTTKRKRRLDVNEIAFRVVQEATGRKPKPRLPESPSGTQAILMNQMAGAAPVSSADSAEPADSTKNPAAVALGRLGGLKGGPARAKKLSKKRLSQIGREAARKRWAKRR